MVFGVVHQVRRDKKNWRELPYLGPIAVSPPKGWVVAADGAKLHCLAPPDGFLEADEVGFFASGEVEIEPIALLKDDTIGPALVFFEMSRLLVAVDEGDLLGRTLHNLLGLESEGRAGGRLGRHLIGDFGEQENEGEDCREDGDFLHGERAS